VGRRLLQQPPLAISGSRRAANSSSWIQYTLNKAVAHQKKIRLSAIISSASFSSTEPPPFKKLMAGQCG
jgi:hypothetical protein